MRHLDVWIVPFLAIALITGSGAVLLAQATEVTLANLEKRVEEAVTAQDHQAIYDYYSREADLAIQRAQKHETMARIYRTKKKGSIPRPNAMIQHCNKLAKVYRSLAVDLREIARKHQAIAQEND